MKSDCGAHPYIRSVLLAGMLLLAPGQVRTDEADADVRQLDTIIITSTRLPEKQSRQPIAAGSAGKNDIQAARQQLGLDEALVSIPGLFFQSRYNFAQDPRIAIRGFGARASFGIRGIRVYADGIPLTLPDGQSSIDSIDLGSAQRIEVVRGPFSSLYGAASGGVINITTEDGPDSPYLSSRLNAGSYDYLQGQIKAGGQSGKLNYLANASGTTLDGYRDHARYRNLLLNSKFRYDLDEGSDFTVVLNALDSPKAEDPGGLTMNEVRSDRKQAAPRNRLYDAGEEIDQQTIGFTYRRQMGDRHGFTLRNHYVMRDFENRLPFDINSNGQGGSVRLDRLFTGVGGHYAYSGDLVGRENRLALGFDIDAQRDRRKRYENNEGSRGIKTTDQDEDVTSYGIYVRDALQLSDSVTLTLGARHDTVRYDVDDRTGESGSNDIDFTETSPMVGLVWSVNPAMNVYGNIARSFDPPTTTELANPDGPGGFNSELEPQTATNYEIGMKGLLPGSLRYELALFHINVDDELVRYELAGADQSFYENAASSTHQGLEAALTMELLPDLTGSLAYTWSDFTFDRFRDREGNRFDGNKIPGVPDNQIHIGLDYRHPDGFYAGWDLLYAGSFFADNANTVKSDSYKLSGLRAGYTHKWNRLEISPFAGLNNLLDEEYFDNVRLNAGFGRYFEPAPERNYYGGIGVRYDFD